jgi:hypothetical protein
VEPARQLGLKLLPAGAGNAGDFDAAFESMARGGAEAVLNVAAAFSFSTAGSWPISHFAVAGQ